ncbi:MAG: hypothetical protein QXO02_08635 [Thermofilaceae archaeon]
MPERRRPEGEEFIEEPLEESVETDSERPHQGEKGVPLPPLPAHPSSGGARHSSNREER